ncbi:MAG: 30S ribosomal protein S4e [Candidatus Lokiarchaeota archaeon]|nr:30S ribosomal protein S4e [Candidatus Lokiarchaeota archaeon]MCK4480627.1 30S ribosomal protein S4e [Candidatus Lokiarchaeota archaeon]MCK4779283.1 30S ribosomal protein S4e [Candidatus Lokiarchaeota archaeon]
MTRHGTQKVLKRLNTPAFLQIKRKHGKFFVKAAPGPHSSRLCLPLLHIVRDLLKIVDTHREAKKLIVAGYFKVDGKKVRNKSFPVGLMDVISIEKLNLHYRILPDSHHGLILHEISEKESGFKLCRINNKKTVKGGHIQLNLHDGRNILIKVQEPRTPKEDIYKRMDVLKISLPEQEIHKILRFKENNIAIIMSGKNIGQVGKITNILKRFGPKASTVSIQQNGGHTETLYDYTFIIGEENSEINIPDLEN